MMQRRMSHTKYSESRSIVVGGKATREVEVTGEKPDVDEKKSKKPTKKKSGDDLAIACRDLGEADCDGWLHKKTTGFGGSWKKLWCHLKDGVLYVYKTSFDAIALHMIKLNQYDVIALPDDKRKFAFRCNPKQSALDSGISSKGHLFSAETQESVHSWVDILKKASEGVTIEKASLQTPEQDRRRCHSSATRKQGKEPGSPNSTSEDLNRNMRRPQSTAFAGTSETTGMPSSFERQGSTSRPRRLSTSKQTSVLAVGSMFHSIESPEDESPNSEKQTLSDLLYKKKEIVVVENGDHVPENAKEIEELKTDIQKDMEELKKTTQETNNATDQSNNEDKPAVVVTVEDKSAHEDVEITVPAEEAPPKETRDVEESRSPTAAEMVVENAEVESKKVDVQDRESTAVRSEESPATVVVEEKKEPEPEDSPAAVVVEEKKEPEPEESPAAVVVEEKKEPEPEELPTAVVVEEKKEDQPKQSKVVVEESTASVVVEEKKENEPEESTVKVVEETKENQPEESTVVVEEPTASVVVEEKKEDEPEESTVEIVKEKKENQPEESTVVVVVEESKEEIESEDSIVVVESTLVIVEELSKEQQEEPAKQEEVESPNEPVEKQENGDSTTVADKEPADVTLVVIQVEQQATEVEDKATKAYEATESDSRTTGAAVSDKLPTPGTEQSEDGIVTVEAKCDKAEESREVADAGQSGVAQSEVVAVKVEVVATQPEDVAVDDKETSSKAAEIEPAVAAEPKPEEERTEQKVICTLEKTTDSPSSGSPQQCTDGPSPDEKPQSREQETVQPTSSADVTIEDSSRQSQSEKSTAGDDSAKQTSSECPGNVEAPQSLSIGIVVDQSVVNTSPESIL